MMFFKAFALLSMISFVSAAIAPRQSSGPCVYSCPAEDSVGDVLSLETIPGDLICQYDGTNTCVYSSTTGALLTDNNNGECISVAVGSAGCTPSKRAMQSRKLFAARAKKPEQEIPQHVRAIIERRRSLRNAKGSATRK